MPKGDKGDTGEQGPKGETGETGPQGPTGERGLQGEQGIQGIQGEKGEKGDKGEQGATGANGYTPVKGVDYWTNEDKQEIIEDVEEEINPTIEALQEELAEIKAENEDLQSNQLTGQSSGTSIDLSDSADSRVRSIGLSGNSEQESTTGKQLFDIGTSASDYSNSLGNSLIVNDKSIQMKVLASGETITYRTQNLTSNKKYTISGSATIGYSRLYIRMRKNDDSGWLTNNDASIDGWVYNSYYQGWYKENTTKTINQTVTIPECMYWQLGFGFNSMDGYVGTTQTISEIVLNTGDTALPWEPYTGGQASPNPDYPQEIHSTGDIKNLFDISSAAIGFTIDSTTGQNVSHVNNACGNDYIEVEPNTKYTFSGNHTCTNIRLSQYNSEKTNIIRNVENSSDKITITTTENTRFIRWSLNYDDEVMTLDKLKSLNLEIKQGDYNEYGSVNEKVQNKNFIDGVFDNSSGSTITLITKNTDIILPAGTYTASFINKTIGLQSNANIYSGTTNILSLNWYQNVKQLVLTEKTRITKITCDVPANTIIYCQLEQGTTATDYVAHEEQNISFPLAQGQKLMQGDYLSDDGIHHVRGEYAFTGNETGINTDGATTNYRRFTVPKSVFENIGSSAISTHFTYLANYSSDTPHFYIGGSALYFFILSPTAIVNDFKAWLAEQYTNGTPVKVQYKLAEEVIDPYTEEQQAVWEQIKALRTYKPVTHISSTDEVPATVDITYVRDLETVINNISSAVVALGGEVNV